MEKKLIKFHQAEHDVQLKFAKLDLALYNKLLNKLNELLPGVVSDVTIFKKLVENPEEYAFDLAVGDNPLTIGGAPVSKKKAMDLIEFSDNWNKAISEINKFKNELSAKPVHQHGNDQKLQDRLSFDDVHIVSNLFELSSDYIINTKERWAVYTKNENQNRALEHLNAIHVAFVELTKLGVHMGRELSLKNIGFRDYGGVLDAPYEVFFDPTPVIQQVK